MNRYLRIIVSLCVSLIYVLIDILIYSNRKTTTLISKLFTDNGWNISSINEEYSRLTTTAKSKLQLNHKTLKKKGLEKYENSEYFNFSY